MSRILFTVPAILLALSFAFPALAICQEEAKSEAAENQEQQVEEAADETAEQDEAVEEEVVEEVDIASLATIDEIKDAWNEKQAAHSALLKEARGDREKSRELRRNAPAFTDYGAALMKFVDEDPGSEESREAMMWALFKIRDMDAREEIVAKMLVNHIESEELEKIVPGIPIVDSDSAEERLNTVISESPHDSVKAAACYTLYTHLEKANKNADDDEVEALAARLEEVKAALENDYADIEDSRGVTYGLRMEAITFQERLAIGQSVPDIEGEDIEGVSFKLSDYKGKVIVLDFWGHW